jgi:hypothetical protein
VSVDLRLGDYREVLADVGEVDAVITDLAAGCAAEHIACADLLLSGYRAFLADQNCPYDVAVEHDGRLVRLQVKGTRKPRPAPSGANSESYVFHVRRAGKGGRRRYGPGEFDVLALVALDIRRVAYLGISGDTPQCLSVRVPGRRYVPHRDAKSFDSCTFAAAVGI